MKGFINTIILGIIGGALLVGAYLSGGGADQEIVGAPATRLSYTATMLPLSDSAYDVGTSTQAYREGWFDEICFTGGTCETQFPGAGSGEANTGANLGTGFPIFDTKSGVALRFNSIAAGSNVSISTSSDANTLVISSTGGSGGAFSWTPTSWGVATSTTLGFLNGFLSTASSTITGTLHATGGVTGALTGNASTATALASNGSNCSAGSAAGGVSASGVAEDCTDYWTEAENTSAAYISGNQTITLSGDVSGSGTTGITTTIGADKVLESMLKAVNSAVDEDILTYESTTGDFEWHTPAELSLESTLTFGDGLTRTANDIDCDTASGSVFGCLASADWTTFNNKVAGTRALTVAGTESQITSSAGSQDLSADRTWTLSLPNHVIFPSSFQATRSTTTHATSTNHDITGLFTFGGVTGNSWDDFCLSITGGSGLCDGSDATGAGGTGSNWEFTTNAFSQTSIRPTTTVNTVVTGTGTSTFAGGLSAFRSISSPYFVATSTDVASKFIGGIIVDGTFDIVSNQDANTYINLFSGGMNFSAGGSTAMSIDTTNLTINPANDTQSFRVDTSGGGDDNFVVDTTTGRVGISTTTPGTLFSLGNTGANTVNISATATSTFGSGINLRTGCFAINGTCISGGSSHDAVTLAGTPDYLTLSGQQITLGAIDLTTDVTGTLPVGNGGTGAATLTGLLQGNGTSAFTVITNSSTAGQVLRVTGASTYAWGALDLADTDAITGTLPVGNGGTGITSLGTGVATWLGTPSIANFFSALTGEASGAETFLTTASSANLKTLVTDETGSGGALVFATSPSLTTPTVNDSLTVTDDDWIGLGASAGRIEYDDQNSDEINFLNSISGFGTSTPALGQVTIASSTAPQLTLSAGAGLAGWSMRNAGGNLYFATTTVAGTATSSPAAIELNSSGTGVFMFNLTTATGDNALCIDATTKEVEDAGATTCALSSRLAKKDIETIDGKKALEAINQLRAVEYTYIQNSERRYGFIAEEVAQIDPLLVEYAQEDMKLFNGKVIKKGEPLTVDYLRYTAYLTSAVQYLAEGHETSNTDWTWGAVLLLAMWNVRLTLRKK